MKLRTISLGLALAVMSSSVLAVDGYKGVKFGSNLDTLLSSKICTFKKYDNDSTGIAAYACKDFKFSGTNTVAMAFFLDGKFQRLAITLNTNVESVLDGLVKKYGAASSTSTAEEMEKAQTTGEPVYLRFDNDTIFVRGQNNQSTGKYEALLVYSSPSYGKELLKIQSKAVQDDL
ncbi:Uncharacterised protein [Yersinia mollaretii]|uniref:hypothetical protein n=1 Tax=Yersinia mollaretii TaxID=33060 RepID=UPI0005DBD454|nr:hypothetical protein [Yersinia mollaretii]CNJ92458.1 Uncharacterised protein [Yersinia mollaretii]